MLKISIITPSFNQGKFIEATIKSVLNQKDPNLEYFVIDGGSTDQTLKILKKYKNKIIYISKPDKGQASAVNKGLKRASGDIIGWINSDDIYCPNTFKHVRDIFSQNKNINIIYGDYLIIDTNGKQIWHQKEARSIDKNVLLYGPNCISQPTVFIRKKVIQKTGLLNPSLHYALDLDWWLRMLSKGYRFTHTPYPLAKMRLHPSSKTVKFSLNQSKEIQQVKSYYLKTNYFLTTFLSLLTRINRQILRLIHRHQINILPMNLIIRIKNLSNS